MALKINQHQQALWRSPKVMQIGLGPEQVILEDLTPAQEKLIAALYSGIADNQVEAIANQSKLDLSIAHELVEKIRPLMQIPEADRGQRSNSSRGNLDKTEPFSDSAVSSAFAEIIRASLVHGRDGEAVLLERGRRAVHLDDLSKTGLLITLGLAAAGIGAVITHDSSRVSQRDIGNTGYAQGLLGQSRLGAAEWLLRGAPNRIQLVPGSKLEPKQLDNVDCAVIIAHQAIQPRLYARWMNRQVPHIAVVFDSTGVSVSPMITPGITPCLFCLEQQRIDSDEGWPVLASQLLTSELRFDDSASQLFAAGIVLKKILQTIDSGPQSEPIAATGYRFLASDGTVSDLKWPMHKACSCGESEGSLSA